MNQDEINQAEWNNRANWSFVCYHSPRDTRFLVPKRFGWGWTINMRSKTFARVFMTVLLTVAAVGLITALILPLIFLRR